MPATADIARYAEGLITRLRARATVVQARQAELQRQAGIAAGHLADLPGVTRVWLFGSVAWGGMHEESDLDLMIEGLPAGMWSTATAIVEQHVAINVDLLRTEALEAAFVERVRREGVLIYERR